MQSLSIIIPCFNERFTIEFILLKVLCSQANDTKREIIVIDDFSTDGSREKLERLNNNWEQGLRLVLQKWVQKHPSNKEYEELFNNNILKTNFKLIFHEQNRGKGYALRTGIKEANGDIIIIQDADLEYDPFEYPKLLEPIFSGQADVVYGSRYLGETRKVLNFRHTHGNKFLTLLSNLFTDLNLSDMETCYKVFKSSIIKSLNLESDRFGFEPEVTAKLAHIGCSIYEVPISYSGRTFEEGKKIGFKDAFQALWCIIKYNLFPGQVVKNTYTKDTYRMSESVNYNKEIFRNINKYIGQKVLETGSGIGSFTTFFKNNHNVTATDNNDMSISILKNRFINSLNVDVIKWDVTMPPDKKITEKKYNTITAINILEHIEDDEAAIKQFYTLLPDNGNLIIMSPYSKFLYSKLDKKLNHYRRYTKKELKEKLEKAGFKVKKIYFFNLTGYFGWLFFVKLFNKNIIPNGEINTFDRFAKFTLGFERKVIKPLIGLSVIAIAEKSVKV